MKGQEQACLLGLPHTFPLLAPKVGLAREMLEKVVLDAGTVTRKDGIHVNSVLFRAMQERGLLLRQILEVALGMRTYGRRTAGKTEQT
jgi:hypothetical protein